MRWTRSGFVALVAIVGSVAAGCETETEGLGDGPGGSGGSAGAGGSVVTVTGGHPAGDASAEADAAHDDGPLPDANGDTSLDVGTDAAPDVSSDSIAAGDANAGDGAVVDGAVVSDGSDVSAPMDGGPDGAEGSTDGEATEAERDAANDGDGGSARPRVCAAQCNSNADCPANGQTPICDLSHHHCVTCLSDATCVAQQSGWIVNGCTTDTECTNLGAFGGDYCVDIDGTGLCAFDASKMGMFQCFMLNDSFSVKKFATNDTVTVCADLTKTCDTGRGACIICAGGCSPAVGGNTCNQLASRCECASNADCGGSAPNCNLTLHQCECGSSADCPSGDGGGQICN